MSGRHLRIVRDEPPRKRRKGQRGPAALTDDQQAKVRAALRNLRMAYGGWAPLAEVMGMATNQLAKIASSRGYAITGDVLVRVCRAGSLSADAMLDVKLTESGRCAACGARRAS